MKNYLFSFLTSVTLVLSGVLYAQGSLEENKNNLFIIDDQTTISFSSLKIDTSTQSLLMKI